MKLKQRFIFSLRGVGSLLGIFPHQPRTKISNPYATATDVEMIQKDWEAVGGKI